MGLPPVLNLAFSLPRLTCAANSKLLNVTVAAAHRAVAKPPDHDLKQNFKTANGRRDPLADLLGFEIRRDS